MTYFNCFEFLSVTNGSYAKLEKETENPNGPNECKKNNQKIKKCVIVVNSRQLRRERDFTLLDTPQLV